LAQKGQENYLSNLTFWAFTGFYLDMGFLVYLFVTA
jgi:hypothetical protein